jgi:hypothetical protein
LKSCIIPTSSPITVQLCDDTCVENWECEWGACERGVSVPECRDLNGCGSSYSVPKELPCQEGGSCTPNVVCGEWSECNIDYNFADLLGPGGIAELSGSKTRICVDEKGCVLTQREEEECSIGVDIYTERFERCGEQYVAVLDILDDSTLAVLKEGGEENFYLNIYFDDKDGVRCDYCFDGEMNGDEEGVDCGGSCKSCSVPVYEVEHWWDFLF